MICAVVFSIGILRGTTIMDIGDLPHVVFPCRWSDTAAYHYYAANDPQIVGSRNMTDDEIEAWIATHGLRRN